MKKSNKPTKDQLKVKILKEKLEEITGKKVILKEQIDNDFIGEYFGKDITNKFRSIGISTEELNHLNNVLRQLDEKTEDKMLNDERFERKIISFDEFYAKETFEEIVKYFYEYIKKFKFLLDKKVNTASALNTLKRVLARLEN